jgi:heat shock protein HslJ
MHDANGVPFGQTIWVAIEVRDTAPGEPTPTATIEASPTPPPPPTAEPTATEAPPAPEPTEEPGSELRDVPWVLEEYRVNLDDEQLTEPIPDIDLTLNFEEDGNISSFAGCNTFSGRYVTDGVQIIFRDLLGTQLACEQPEGIMEQEALYRQWLERSEEYRIDEDGQLELITFMIENNQRVEKIMLRFYDQRVGP